MTDSPPSDSSPRPFVAAPHADRYFPAAIFEESRQRIARSIERGEGPALLIGGAGIGKTMLLEVLAQQFRGSMAIAPVAGAQLCTRRALLQMVLFHAGLPYRGLEEGELRLSLLDFLRPDGQPPRRLLLLVDEAESLPDRLLEELRVLTNIADAGQPLVSLVLVGTAILEERFADPRLEAFSQRVSSRSYLAPMGREETMQYIRAQVAAVVSEPDGVFTDDGLEAMFAVTDGVPRLINQLGDHLFWLADESGYSPLDAEIVQQAWSESQQLPAPWNTPSVETAGSPVEFGELALDDEESAGDLIREDQRSLGDLAGDEEAPVGDQDVDDDMPASIPIGSASTFEQLSDGVDAHFAKTFNATEEILQHLNRLEQVALAPKTVESPAASPAVATTAPSARNPFLEEFESEELILDRYSDVESQRLSSAQKVVNRDDTSFGQQLRQFEIVDTSAITVAEPCAASPESVESPADRAPADAAPAAEAALPDACPSELLVIEDESAGSVEVVPGKSFRQLFSSIESASSTD